MIFRLLHLCRTQFLLKRKNVIEDTRKLEIEENIWILAGTD